MFYFVFSIFLALDLLQLALIYFLEHMINIHYMVQELQIRLFFMEILEAYFWNGYVFTDWS